MSREVLAEIKQGRIDPVYFLYGNEPFLLEETMHRMRELLGDGSEDPGAVVIMDLDETPVQHLIDEAEVPPFFSERRVIIGKNAHFLTAVRAKGGPGHDPDRLIAYLQQPLPTSVVILTVPSDKLDKRKKAVKELELRARCIRFDPLGGKEILAWLQQRFKELGVEADPRAVRELALLVGPDLRRLDNECRKLAVYVGDAGKVDVKTVSALVPRTLEQDVFKLTESIARRQTGEALRIWRDLLHQREEPLRVLSLITRQFRLMLQVKALARQGLGEKEIAARLKVHPYPVKLALRQGQAFSEKALRGLLLGAVAADREIKTGRTDKVLAVERLILNVHQGT
ncbi:DNA polymerase III subunit delta [Staphylospora marina]|uniref:DNA polymerase III subunit delta n=1 Tax=Staphylospora marina TaxID=2490858 RepID=UPI0013DE458E|nr:DNA polymerase III subunit delta [Staphylospora marina]